MLTCLSCGEARIRAVGAGTGARLPRCYGAVSVQRTPGSGVEGDIVRGLWLEYIASTTLRQFVDTWMTLSPPLPLEVLKAVCDAAVAVVDRVSDLAGLQHRRPPEIFSGESRPLWSSSPRHCMSRIKLFPHCCFDRPCVLPLQTNRPN